MAFINIPVHKIDSALVFQCGMVIDADGAKNAYRADNQGLDDIKDAKTASGRYVGVVTVNGKPLEMPDGSYVSPSSLHDPNFPVNDQRRYVDASSVPGLAVCPQLLAMGCKLGDLAIVLYKDALTGLVLYDVSPNHHYGEASMAAAPGVGLSGSPRIGGVDSGCTYVVFPDTASSPPWPRVVVEFQQAAMDAFDALDGVARLRAMGLLG